MATLNTAASHINTCPSRTSDEVVRHYVSMVRRAAYHLAGRVPDSVQVDDLVQAGMLGLLDAYQKYDSRQGASFETYAHKRIRGAMLDELRKCNWTPRSVTRMERDIYRTIREIEAELGRNARDTEVAERLGISLKDYHQALQDASASKLFSLDEMMDSGAGLTESSPVGGANPSAIIEWDEIKEKVTEVMERLPRREKLVMSLYYEQQLNLREIGTILNVSESRVCQIHGRALLRLKAQVSGW
jgi:RNA polymerase sigma factor for flagellar operon FliA